MNLPRRVWLAAALLSCIGAVVAPALRDAEAQEPPLPTPAVIDLHVDLPFAVHGHGRQLADERAETSPSRLRRGKVAMLVLPLYVRDGWKRPPQDVRADYQATHDAILAAIRAQGDAAVLLEPGAAAREGRIQTMISFEGADGFADDPSGVVPWIERGACLVGLVHSHTNALAGGSMDPRRSKRSAGLTEVGKRLARTVYAAGGLVDLSHMTDASMRDMVPIAKEFGAPLVATHMGMRALRGIERNIADEQLRAIKDSHGVVGIDLHSGHIGRVAGARATLDDVVRHLDHAVAIAGIEHVAIGSDLDGGIEQPSDADGAATWPGLAWKLRQKGWSEQQIEALYRGNAARVLRWAKDHGCAKRP